MKHWYQTWLVPYAEGTLDERRRAKLEARLARDPALAAEAEAMRRTSQRLRAAAQNEKSAPAPDAAPAVSELWPGIEARLRPARRTAPRPWLWAGGLCAAASLAWATLWGPLTHHTANTTQHGTTVAQTVPEAPPSSGTPRTNPRRGGHPRKSPRNFGRPAKHPVRVKKKAPPARPDPADLLANGVAPAPTTDGTQDATDATPSASGHLRLATDVHDLHRQTPDQDGAGDTSGADDGGVAKKTDDVVNGAPAPETPSRPSRRQRRHRHHRRHRSTEPPAPTQTTPALPPDTVPQAETAPKVPKHRPDID